MSKRVSMTQARTYLSALLRRVKRGESILILQRGIPVAQMVPDSATDPEPLQWALEPKKQLQKHPVTRRARRAR